MTYKSLQYDPHVTAELNFWYTMCIFCYFHIRGEGGEDKILKKILRVDSTFVFKMT